MRISDWSSDVCSSDLSGACAKHRDRRLPPPDTGRLAFFRDQREILVRSGNQIVGALPQYAAQAPLGGGKQHLPVGMPCIRGNGKAKTVQLTNGFAVDQHAAAFRSEEHTSELQSLMRTSYAVFCLKKKK